MSLPGVLASGRAAAEARMLSHCTIRRQTSATTVDDDGMEWPVWEDVYTALPLRLAGISRGQSQSRHYSAGDVEFEIGMRTAHFPASTDNLRDGDLIDITSGDNAGMVLRIVEADWQDQATARRVPVVTTARPGEWS